MYPPAVYHVDVVACALGDMFGMNAAKNEADYFFAENGLVAYKEGQVIGVQSLKTWLGEDKLKEFINFVLHYIADLDIPIKRGTFIEFRNGMLNVSPIGRNCNQQEREDFEKFDLQSGIRCGGCCDLACCQAKPIAIGARPLVYVLSHCACSGRNLCQL